MPKTHEMLNSTFLKKEDVGNGALMTVAGCEQQNVAKQGAEPELKWCLMFQETDKPFVLNSTNIQLCQRVFGSDDTDDWVGHQIVLYTDPNVSFAGKVVGGIRVRAPKQKVKAAAVERVIARATAERVPLMDEDDIPF